MGRFTGVWLYRMDQPLCESLEALLPAEERETEVDLSTRAKMKSLWKSGRGLGWIVTSYFIVADMVGGGLVAMPVAFISTGLQIGLISMLGICTIFAYTAYLLGKNWVTMQERWPEYREHCRKPYPEIALRSMGMKLKIITGIAIYVTMFGTAVVYVLLSSRIFQNFILSLFHKQMGLCTLIVIVSIAITPLTYFKSPADFWVVVIFAMVCTVIAVILSIIGIAIDFPKCMSEAYYAPISIMATIPSIGTFLFAFSGHHIFPSIQHDMYRPKDFSKSVILGFIIVSLLYMPVSVYGYITYGNSMRSSVIESIQTPIIRYLANLAISLHCILALTMMANPLGQQIEHIFKAPLTFGLHRVIIRTGVMFTIMFCALTFPDFIPFMNTVGSATNPIVAIILPILFYLYLEAATYNKQKQEYEVPSFTQVIKRTNPLLLLINFTLIVIAVVGCVITVSLSVQEILTVKFTPPCYLSPLFPQRTSLPDVGAIYCCGMDRNILTYGNSTELCNH